jgi:microcompartment protein CcmK/EutM
MNLGRVVGRTWATVKSETLNSRTLLVVQPVTPEGKPTGRSLVCTDWAGAGPGDLIYWARSKEASFAFLPDEVATDATVVAIIDELHVKRT